MSEKIWWHLARAGGIVAWALVAASILWGLALSTRVFAKRPAPGWLLDLHRFLGGLSIVFTLMHVGALVADSYVHFGPSEILVPLASAWRPVAVAWGVVAFYVLLAIQGTSLAMRRLPRAVWKRVHQSSVVLYVLATAHGLAAGSDVGNPALQWTMVGVTVAALFLLVVRILSPRSALAKERRVARTKLSAGAEP